MWVGGSEGRHQIPGHGGAVFASRADRTPFAPSARWRLLAVRFEGNSAAGMGGAVYSAGVAMTLARCTFIGNAAGTGDAVAAVVDAPGGWLAYDTVFPPQVRRARRVDRAGWRHHPPPL